MPNSLIIRRFHRVFGIGTRRYHTRRLFVEQLEDRQAMAVVDLASLGSGGTTIFGADAEDQSGFSVSDAGDVNGDGFDDIVIGARYADGSENGKDKAGESYVIFGKADFTASPTIDLANLGTAGFTILGAEEGDHSGHSVSSAGDINGDGFGDLVVGALNADHGDPVRLDAGASYVIFGKADWTATPTIDLANLGSFGIIFLGVEDGDSSGFSVSGVGDLNGDGFGDLAIGAEAADALGNAKPNAGETYVIFGKANWNATLTIELSSLSTTGITILGAGGGDQVGSWVSGAGDVNGDGFHDLFIGARFGDALANAKTNAGESYVIFGKADWTTTPTIDLATLGTAGITIFGADAFDRSGRSLSSAGDVNGDGFDDLVIGAYLSEGAENANDRAGESYVIFGKSDWSTTLSIDLLTLGTAGITIYGGEPLDLSGVSVRGAGDVNGDGFDDVLIGASFADASANAKSSAGESYVVFGKADWSTTSTIQLSSLGSAGITLFGVDIDDQSGGSVSGAGDVNGDGFDDIVVGAASADALNNAKSMAGESYVIFGGNGFTNSILAANLGDLSANTLSGTASAEILNGADGDDTLFGAGGSDILLGGRGDDILVVGNLAFGRIVGSAGNDTLRLDGNGYSLDLTAIRDNRIVDVESIDISGNGNNALTLTHRDVLNISSSTNTLLVRRNAGDSVNIGSGWTQVSNQTIGSDTFNVYTQGAARVLVQTTSPDTTPPTVVAVIASGSAWSPALIDSVDGGGTGAGNGLGYALTPGSTLPNLGIDRLYLQFSEPVVGFNASRFQLLGVNVTNYSTSSGFLTVSYDSANSRGVIQFANNITRDKLRIGVFDSITDFASNALDGDTNAVPGGIFDFRFNMLVGDANNDGSVNGGDIPFFASSFNQSVGAVGFNPRANWNSDDSVNGGDLPLFASNFNQSLPSAEPGAVGFPSPTPSNLAAVDEDDWYAPSIDDYFNLFDNEEDLLLLYLEDF